MTILEHYIKLINTIGDSMTERMAAEIMDDAKRELSISDFEILANNVGGAIYTLISQYEGEMGGFARY